MDSYSILGIEKESSMEDIEKAYIDKISKIKISTHSPVLNW